MNEPLTTNQIIIVDVVGIAIVLIVATIGLLMMRAFIKRVQAGRGPMGSLMQRSHDIGRENVAVSKERLQVEKELLAAQMETNDLLRRALAQLEKKP